MTKESSQFGTEVTYILKEIFFKKNFFYTKTKVCYKVSRDRVVPH